MEKASDEEVVDYYEIEVDEPLVYQEEDDEEMKGSDYDSDDSNRESQDLHNYGGNFNV